MIARIIGLAINLVKVKAVGGTPKNKEKAYYRNSKRYLKRTEKASPTNRPRAAPILNAGINAPFGTGRVRARILVKNVTNMNTVMFVK